MDPYQRAKAIEVRLDTLRMEEDQAKSVQDMNWHERLQWAKRGYELENELQDLQNKAPTPPKPAVTYAAPVVQERTTVVNPLTALTDALTNYMSLYAGSLHRREKVCELIAQACCGTSKGSKLLNSRMSDFMTRHNGELRNDLSGENRMHNMPLRLVMFEELLGDQFDTLFPALSNEYSPQSRAAVLECVRFVFNSCYVPPTKGLMGS